MARFEGITGECKYEVNPITSPDDVVNIALRELDALELELTVRGGIPQCVRDSDEAYSVEIQGRPEAYFGITSEGVVWWLSSWKPIRLFPRDFQRLTDHFLNRWLQKYKRLWNTTLTQNTVAIQWLKSKGFTTRCLGEWTTFWKEVHP